MAGGTFPADFQFRSVFGDICRYSATSSLVINRGRSSLDIFFAGSFRFMPQNPTELAGHYLEEAKDINMNPGINVEVTRRIT
jgi:hypothetical protein